MPPTIGFLTSRAPGADAHLLEAFREGLAEAGYVEGHTVDVAYAFASNDYGRLPALAAELVRQQPALIFANGVSAAAVRAASSTIPLVFTTGGDPVKSGLVRSLERPGGSATGAITLNIGNGPKRLGLICEAVPTARAVAFAFNPESPLTDLEAMQAAASHLGRRLIPFPIANDDQLEAVFAELTAKSSTVMQLGGQSLAGDPSKLGSRDPRPKRALTEPERRGAPENQARRQPGGKPQALVVGADPFFVSRRERLVALAAQARLPAIYFGREFTDAAGFMSYAASLAAAYRQAGIYAGRILAGAKPADLPVVQPDKFELVINLRAARGLGLLLPISLLEQTDQLIDL